MKTTILAAVSVAALMTANAASAQTYPFYAPITQSSADASSSVDQIGDYNTASTDQTHSAPGAQNNSVIVQGFDGVYAAGNSASVTQSGSGQRAVTLQVNTNTASTNQGGSNNNAFTYQTGSANHASTTQTQTNNLVHTANPGAVNGVGSVSGGDGLANSLANVDETHMEMQTYNGINGADVFNESASYVVQAGGAYNDGATVSQSGSAERAAIVQVNYETTSTAGITQTAWVADAFIHQDGGSYNNAGISQAGAGQSAGIYQSNSTGSIGSVNQSGQNNFGYAVQTGTAQQSYITQSNTTGDLNNQAKTVQSGNNEFSIVNQTGTHGSGLIIQSGSVNTSYLTQAGDQDAADVTQAGAYNTSSIGQSLNNGWAHVNQSGTGNSSTISQH